MGTDVEGHWPNMNGRGWVRVECETWRTGWKRQRQRWLNKSTRTETASLLFVSDGIAIAIAIFSVANFPVVSMYSCSTLERSREPFAQTVGT